MREFQNVHENLNLKPVPYLLAQSTNHGKSDGHHREAVHLRAALPTNSIRSSRSEEWGLVRLSPNKFPNKL
jgi:hypothetical protein